MIEPYMITGTEEIIRWDTWEELVLGGAVLRHGTRAWDAIAAELQARTLRPLGFTAEACKDKFKELQERFSGCRAWFEELRKQRVAELKRDLEISEDSIGSLQSKLESLKSEKGEDRRFDFDSSRTESPATFGNSSEVAEFPGKEASKDGLSAGSFTEETPANLPEYQNPAMVSAQETNTKTESSDDRERDKIADVGKPVEVVGIAGGVSVRKKRGKRKRRDCNRDVNEGSVGENDVLSSATVATIPDKEESTGDYDRGIISSDDDRNGRCGEVEVVELMAILDSVMENQNGSVFRRRLDSQRRSRYKKTVRRHLDFDTIRSRIVDRSITSAGELFRDMLLLATNAVVFYPKNTRQFKSALSLRELVKKTFRHIDGESCRGSGVAAVAAAPIVGEPSTRNPTVKPRSVRPYNRKVTGKVVGAENVVSGTTSRENEKVHEADPPVESAAVAKKGVGRPGKSGRGGVQKQPENSAKGRKRARR